MSQRDRSDPVRLSPASSNHLTAEDDPTYRRRNGEGTVSGRGPSPRGGSGGSDDEGNRTASARLRRRRTSGRTASRPSPRTLDLDNEDDPEEDGSSHLPELGDIDDGEAPPRRRTQDRVTRHPSIGATAVARSRSRDRRHAPSLRIPTHIAQSELVADQVSLALIGTAVFSLLLMWITVANRVDALPAVMDLRYGPEGLPSLSTAPRALFRLPLLATIVTLMNVTVAWFVSPGDRFAGRFIVAAAMLIQLLIWIAAAALVW